MPGFASWDIDPCLWHRFLVVSNIHSPLFILLMNPSSTFKLDTIKLSLQLCLFLSVCLSSGQRNVSRSSMCNICEVSLKGGGVPFSFYFMFPAGQDTGMVVGAGTSILDHEVTLGMLATHSGAKTKNNNKKARYLGPSYLVLLTSGFLQKRKINFYVN